MDIETRSAFYPITIEPRAVEGDPLPRLGGRALPYDTLSPPIPFLGLRERFRSGAFSESLQADNQKALLDHEQRVGSLLADTVSGRLRFEDRSEGLDFELRPVNTRGAQPSGTAHPHTLRVHILGA